MKFEISQELAQVILNYLAEKPYRETFQLIAELQKLTPIQETDIEPPIVENVTNNFEEENT